jgi:glutamate dehydrogenase (NAD(P)+)
MPRDPFHFADELGPAKVVHLHEPASGLKAIVVVDNVLLGPAIGGVRMAADASLEECFRLARAMTLKAAAAGLPHGGAKSVLFADPEMPRRRKELLLRSFAGMIRELSEYIPAPDMGTDEWCMTWVRDEIGRCAGLPAELGGIPLDEIGATGRGVAIACEVACRHAGIPLAGARVAIQGFGAVGSHAARFLAQRGTVIVAVADIHGAVAAEAGLDVEALRAHSARTRTVRGFAPGRELPSEAVVEMSCDIFVPAARPDAIHARNVDRLRARLVVSGANVPMSVEIEELLHRRGVLVVPDFIANAGGLICASVEYHGGTRAQAITAIETKLRESTAAVLEAAAARNITPRQAAVETARARIEQAKHHATGCVGGNGRETPDAFGPGARGQPLHQRAAAGAATSMTRPYRLRCAGPVTEGIDRTK